jgi:DNA-binding PadR family transcriptional regulator
VPRTPTRSLPGAAECTLLGLIALAPASAEGVHGYDLNRQVAEGALAEIIRLEPGMVYHYLKKLERLGLIATTVEQQTARPDRHLHVLTDEGRARFDAWLAEPVQATRELRLEFLLKLWFARRLDVARASTLVADQRAVVERLITSLRTQLTRIDDASEDGLFARKVIELRLAQNEAARAWLNGFPP